MEVSDKGHAPALLQPGKNPTLPIELEAEWIPELVWVLLEEKIVFSLRELDFDSSEFDFIA
jgi:hypothetical protein